MAVLKTLIVLVCACSQDAIESLVLRVVRQQAALAERTERERRAEREREEKRKEERKQKKKAEEDKKRKAKEQDDGVVELNSDGTFDLSSANPAATPPSGVEEPKANTDDADKQGEKEEEEEEDKTPPPPGNGGVTDRYVWTQALGDLTVVIPVPEGTKSKQVNVEISSNKLRVGLKGAAPIVDGQLHKRVKVTDRTAVLCFVWRSLTADYA